MDDRNQGVQLLFGGIPAKRNTERTVNGLRGDLHGIQNMAPVTLGAGAAGADANAVVLKNVDGILGGNSGDTNG